MFSLKNKTAILLGGAGVLGADMAKGLAAAGANIAVADFAEAKAKALAAEIAEKYGVKAEGYFVNAMEKSEIEKCRDLILKDFGSFDILVNAVGGNKPAATTNDKTDFFNLDSKAVGDVMILNLMGGAMLPCQVFGPDLVNNDNGGVIINISSMNAFRPLTRIPGYSAAKAAVSNFTQWLAVDMAQKYGEKIRVNAIAPGFFLTDQNRFLLTNEADGSLTKRGEQILTHTPMGRFGDPEDLIGTLVWLCSDASKFVTGIVVPVDGGFSAYSGV
ncbi:MAG: SDR family oxidoreductase [Clostridia bacterium]|nr:SDR family oxidoreductase [Clostridia bacterium]MBO5300027.1 SDR family oxidoreductase [Clostridia bacterium]